MCEFQLTGTDNGLWSQGKDEAVTKLAVAQVERTTRQLADAKTSMQVQAWRLLNPIHASSLCYGCVLVTGCGSSSRRGHAIHAAGIRAGRAEVRAFLTCCCLLSPVCLVLQILGICTHSGGQTQCRPVRISCAEALSQAMCTEWPHTRPKCPCKRSRFGLPSCQRAS